MQDSCWLWAGSIKDDYPVMWIPGTGSKRHRAHRVVYESLVGEIPEGFSLDHLCRVKRCVNPAHLEPVTHAENVRRGNSGKWQSMKTHCPRGHEYKEENIKWSTNPNGTRSRGCRNCANIARREKRRADKLLRAK